ncbi:MAG TPA: shikimate dehydrogenase [Anaerolineales bacterium]|nr:shikimate dehydrogenase [Anaerolineales bacterium]
MIQLGLIGYPLGHSLSPKIQSAALRACGLEGDYSLFPIHPDDRQALEDLLSRVRVGEIHGLNVTIPHKQNVISYLDELTPTARAIGAVNTIYLREDKLIGDNTDAPGFLIDLKRFLGNRKSQTENRKSSIVLGAGGSARAVVYALLNDGWDVTLVARRIEQAHQLALSFPGHKIHTMHYESFILHPSREAFSLLVNTTPVGMTPNIDESPWPEDVDFPPHAAIYDLVYNPRETKLVRDACSQGRPAMTGLGMLIEQAGLAFEIWTGHKPPRDVMFDAVAQPAH